MLIDEQQKKRTERIPLRKDKMFVQPVVTTVEFLGGFGNFGREGGGLREVVQLMPIVEV